MDKEGILELLKSRRALYHGIHAEAQMARSKAFFAKDKQKAEYTMSRSFMLINELDYIIEKSEKDECDNRG